MAGALWFMEVIVNGELVVVNSDGTKDGTFFDTSSETEESLRLIIQQGRRMNIVPDGPRIPVSYSPVGMIAALSALDHKTLIRKTLPDEAVRFLKEEYGIKHVDF